MVFHWRLRDGKFLQVSGNFLSILAVLNNVLVWMVSSRPSISNSSSRLSNLLGTVPSALITIGITVTFMFIQATALLRSARILRRVLEPWRDLLSFIQTTALLRSPIILRRVLEPWRDLLSFIQTTALLKSPIILRRVLEPWRDLLSRIQTIAFSSKVRVHVSLFAFFYFHSEVRCNGKIL